jgi:hypothetical protein
LPHLVGRMPVGPNDETMENIAKVRSPWRKRTNLTLLFLCLLASVSLWLYSASLYYRPLPQPAFSVTGHSFVFRICSGRGAIQTTLTWGYPEEPSVGFSSVPNLERFGHHPYGQGFDLGGFVLRVLPHTVWEGDYNVPPFAAIVIPYWATTTGASLLLLWVSGFYPRLRPYMRFSKHSVALMGVLGLVFVVANVYPWTTRHDGVLREYGFPATYLIRAVWNNETLTSFMGYSLGWRQQPLAEDFLLAVLVVLAAGVCVEFLRHRFAPECRSRTAIGGK